MLSDRAWTTATVRKLRDVAVDVREISLQPPGGAAGFAPGSHLGVVVSINGKRDVRYYSLVGHEPRDNCWRIAVKRGAPGRGGAQHMWTLQVDDQIEISAPKSNFALIGSTKPVILIAGGIGVTPLVGMACVLAAQNASVRFLYAGRSRSHMAFIDELEAALGSSLQIFASDENQRIDLEREFANADRDAEAYICGPISLLDGARVAWARAGRSNARLMFETFGSSGHFKSQEFTVLIPSRGKEIAVPESSTMLDALEAAGIHVLSDCRRGECGLCVVKVISATAPIDHRDVYFSDAQRASNESLCACVTRIAGGSVTIDAGYRGDEPLRSGPEIRPHKEVPSKKGIFDPWNDLSGADPWMNSS